MTQSSEGVVWKLATVNFNNVRQASIVLRDDEFMAIEAQPATQRLLGRDGPPTMMEILDGWEEWHPLLAEMAARLSVEPGLELDEPILRAPVPNPRKVFCAGANYASHIREMGREPPDKTQTKPFFFMKPPTAVIGPNEPIVIPPGFQHVDWEVELAAIIGKTAKRVPVGRAAEYVAGYTILNDISARDTHRREDWGEGAFYWDWLQSKGADTFAPMGPFLVPRSVVANPYNLRLTLSVNTEMMQDSNTADLIFNVEEQIAFLSTFITLEPGDVISTGTPPGVGAPRGIFLARGDEVIAEIEQIGSLRNYVL